MEHGEENTNFMKRNHQSSDLLFLLLFPHSLTTHELLPDITKPFLGFSHSKPLLLWIFLNDETIRAICHTLFSRTR